MADLACLDPQFIPIVTPLAELPPMSRRSLEEIRSVDVSKFGPAEPIAELRIVRIPAVHHEIAARLYVPASPAGLLVYFHGGGWVFGSLDTHEVPLRAFANRTGAAILSVAYRLAPEHPFPAGLNDCLSALEWADRHVEELLGRRRPLFVGGDSAGGNLAAAVAHAARDQGGPNLAGQLLLYPSLDGRCATASWREHAACPTLKAGDMRWYWEQYIADPQRRLDPLASPGLTKNLSKLPPAIVVAAEIDPLRDEVLAYARSLAAASNAVTLLHYRTMPHGFFNFFTLVDAARVAFEDIAVHFKRLLKAHVET